MKLSDIPMLLDHTCDYDVTVAWWNMDSFFANWGSPIEFCPNFQRGRVWTEEQQSRYVEYVARGGRAAKELTFATDGIIPSKVGASLVLVDGLQRITAAQKFLRNELPIFGRKLLEWEDGERISRRLHYRFNIRVIDTDRCGTLQLYLDLNSGTPHTDSELKRVRKLLEKELETK